MLTSPRSAAPQRFPLSTTSSPVRVDEMSRDSDTSRVAAAARARSRWLHGACVTPLLRRALVSLAGLSRSSACRSRPLSRALSRSAPCRTARARPRTLFPAAGAGLSAPFGTAEGSTSGRSRPEGSLRQRCFELPALSLRGSSPGIRTKPPQTEACGQTDASGMTRSGKGGATSASSPSARATSA